jgi:putative intracellular protease/amidase
VSKTAASHPAPDRLAAFLAGRLAPAEQAEVERHVAGCDHCCRLLRQVPRDTILGALRGSTHDETPRQVRVPTAAPGVPAELQDHPRYRIVGILGHGGMGTVFLAEHRLMERKVALKVIRSDLVNDPLVLERFRREVRGAARLSHPNLVAALDAEQAGSLHFLVMEYVEGVSLDRMVAQHGPLSVVEACAAVHQAALGLQHAFEKGMIHRDVKPANLMRMRDGTIKVLDFGLARLTEARRRTVIGQRGQLRPMTQIGTMLGTPDFVAPEQANDSCAADVRADVYGLGCTLYFLLAGRVPFPGGSAVDKLLAHLKDEPSSLTALRPEVPPALAEVVARMMAKVPGERYQTPGEVAAALAPFATEAAPPVACPPVADDPGSPAAVADDPGSPRPVPRRRGPGPRRRFRRWLVLAVVAGLLAGVALVAWTARSRSNRSASPAVAGPRILLVVPSRDFWYPDYRPVRDHLEKGGARVKVAATVSTPCTPAPGEGGEPVKPDLLLADVRASDFDAVVFIGGPGVSEFFCDKKASPVVRCLVRDMRKANRPVAAICMAPPVIAGAGAFDDQPVKRATATPRFRPAVDKLKELGVEWVDEPVVVCGPIITARDPNAAEPFAAAVLKAARSGPKP